MEQLKNVCVIIPDISQGMPLVESLSMCEVSSIFFKNLPLRCFLCSLKSNLKVYLTCMNSENISQDTISLLTIKTIEELSPDLVISLDTCDYIGSCEMTGEVCVVSKTCNENSISDFENICENALKIAKIFELPYMKILSSTSKDLPRKEYDFLRYTQTFLRDNYSNTISIICKIYSIPVLHLRGVSRCLDEIFEYTVEDLLNVSKKNLDKNSIMNTSKTVKNMCSACENILKYFSEFS